jgi:hypothetical protein
MKNFLLFAILSLTVLTAKAQNALYYNSTDGSAAIVALGADNGLSVVKESVDLLGKDWTNAVHTGGKVLLYNNKTGAGAIATVTATDLKVNNTFDVGKLPTGYTHLIGLNSGRVLCYNATDGSGNVGSVTANNEYKNLKSFPAGTLPKGWTHIIAVNTVAGATKIVYYNSATGAAAIGSIASDGMPQIAKNYEAGKFTPGWTSLVSVEGKIIYYNANTGAAVLGMLPPNNEHQTIKTYQADGFPKGFTHLTNINGKIVYYNAQTGGTAVGVVTSSEHIFAKPEAGNIKPNFTSALKGMVTIK